MSSTTSQLPSDYRALVLPARGQPPEVKRIPIPVAAPGTAIVKVLATTALSYVRDIFLGENPINLATPQAIGMFAIGRVVALGPDSTALSVGELVFTDPTIRSRDGPENFILQGYGSVYDTEDMKLGGGEWRHGSFAEFIRAPLENVVKLNESRLTGNPTNGGLGYAIPDLVHLNPLLIAYGGLSDVSVTAGDTIVVAPASGGTGWAAVVIALSMGAKVIAMGRNLEKLNSMAARVQNGRDRLITIKISGNVNTDLEAIKSAAGGSVDVYFDNTPSDAANSSHIKASILSLRRGGRMSLMGVLFNDVPMPLFHFVLQSITMVGTMMYTREQREQLVKMIELGTLKLGPGSGLESAVTYNLEDWDVAFDEARKLSGVKPVAFCPWQS